MSKKITEKTLIVDILKSNKNSVAVLEKYNMCCAGCAGVQNETIGKGCLMHGVDAEKVIKELNEVK